MTEAFEVFIESAYIEPIRSVVIVDDDYPTIEEVLTSKIPVKDGEPAPENTKDWVKNPQDILDVVSEFRSKEKKYILDIHDAQNLSDDDEVEGAAHLHQTDLLVLDYQLDPENAEDHSRSLRIARKLFDNDHFNLIIVNTNKDLDEVFEKFLLGLLEKTRLPSLSDIARANVEKAYEETKIPDNFADQLVQEFGFRQYSAVVQDCKNLRRLMTGSAEFAGAAKLFNDIGLHRRYWLGMAMSAILAYQDRSAAAGELSDHSYRVSNFRDSGAVKWIRSNRAFLTFSHKPAKKPLLGALRAALADWKPIPSRLLLAKMSANIESQGVEMQDRALADYHSSALWFRDLLQSNDVELKSTIDNTVRRHIEAMVEQVLPEVRSFAETMVASQRQKTEAENIRVVEEHYRINLANTAQLSKAQLNHNALVCSEDVRGWHIQTGHIFDAAGETWVCVSPPCDMVPAQMSKDHIDLHGERLRFSAMKLYKRKSNILPDHIQSNQYLFLSACDGVDIYSITDGPRAMPDIGVFYAENKGIFEDGFKFTLIRPEEDQESKKLSVAPHPGLVRFQLRYEYAQNLVQRLGGAVTRVGLDYVG